MVSKMDKVLLEQNCSTLPWILEQCYNDNLTVPIIAKGGEVMEVSKLLITVISPVIKDIMTSDDMNSFQDFVIMMPDVDIKSVIHLIEKIVSMSPTPPDKEIVHELTGVFWNSSLFESNEVKVKDEEECVYDYAILEDNIDSVFNQAEDNMSILQMLDEKISISKCYVKVERIKSEVKTDPSEQGILIEVKDEKKIKRRKKPKRSVWFRPKAPPLPDGRKRPVGRPPGNKSKSKHSSDEDSDNQRKKPRLEQIYSKSNDVLKYPISALTERKYKGKRSSKTVYRHESDSEDSDPEIVSKIKKDRERCEKNDSDFENSNKSAERYRKSPYQVYYPIEENELPKDENFLSAFEKLKEALIDDSYLKDLEVLWYELLGPRKVLVTRRNYLIDDKLICPLCMVVFKYTKDYFKHLTRHKVDNYKCTCDLPQVEEEALDSGDDKEAKAYSARYQHLLKHHWDYLVCSHCDLLFRSDKMDKHQSLKHNIKPKCPECPKSIFKNSAAYLMHMEEHRAERFDCDCGIYFTTKKHKIHHIQLVHAKELECCDECYHVALDVKSLNHHKRREHTKQTDQKPRQKVICDICGYVIEISRGHSYDSGLKRMKEHKSTKHNPVLVPCPECSKMVQQHYLRVHMKIHKIEICSVCGKEVKIKNFKRHVAAHNDIWLHKCSHCSKGFNNKQSMDHHIMSVHLKLRPYKCRYGCEFAYNDSSNRNQHEKKKHGALFTKQESAKSEPIQQT